MRPRPGYAADRPTVSPCRDHVTWRTFRRGSKTGRYRWNPSVGTCADGRIEIKSIYSGDVRVIDDRALLTYAIPRIPTDALAAPLRPPCAWSGDRSGSNGELVG